MNENQDLISRFYQAFQQRDHATMFGCYHPDATFEDAVFKLKGKEIGAMWHMLCERGKDLTLEFQVIAEGNAVKAHWEPRYTFSQTGKKVHNIIDAEFEFKDGKIYRHRDAFDFYRWSRQALGVPGVLLGWSDFLHRKVSAVANGSLKTFIRKHPEYAE